MKIVKWFIYKKNNNNNKIDKVLMKFKKKSLKNEKWKFIYMKRRLIWAHSRELDFRERARLSSLICFLICNFSKLNFWGKKKMKKTNFADNLSLVFVYFIIWRKKNKTYFISFLVYYQPDKLHGYHCSNDDYSC